LLFDNKRLLLATEGLTPETLFFKVPAIHLKKNDLGKLNA
jgi:hypothetical protein